MSATVIVAIVIVALFSVFTVVATIMSRDKWGRPHLTRPQADEGAGFVPLGATRTPAKTQETGELVPPCVEQAEDEEENAK